jgi:NAD(P)-dependent dehydrogenase (short-subunit alcohol dehydrogenase family)
MNVTRLRTLSKGKGISGAEAEELMVTASGMTKIVEPEDVANPVAYMVSPQNRYMHGALIDLDGALKCEFARHLPGKPFVGF